jgi:hypothetical protein
LYNFSSDSNSAATLATTAFDRSAVGAGLGSAAMPELATDKEVKAIKFNKVGEIRVTMAGILHKSGAVWTPHRRVATNFRTD